jgi:hypothetical protein
MTAVPGEMLVVTSRLLPATAARLTRKVPGISRFTSILPAPPG